MTSSLGRSKDGSVESVPTSPGEQAANDRGSTDRGLTSPQRPGWARLQAVEPVSFVGRRRQYLERSHESSPGDRWRRGLTLGQPVVHFEVIGTDPAKLRSYYRELFGWDYLESSP